MINVRNGLGVFFTADSAYGYTVPMDSIATFRQSYYMLGSLNDPESGLLKTHIIAQIGLPNASANFSFGDTCTIDSVVLQLAFANGINPYYGDLTSLQKINVYALNENISVDSAYYNKRQAKFDPNPIGTYFEPFHPYDSLRLPIGVNDSELLIPHVRIPLNNDVGTLLRNIDKAGNMTSTSFKNYFKGLYIESAMNPSLGHGAIAYFDLFWGNLNTTTSLVVYYNDSLRAKFPINIQTEARYNYFERPESSYPSGLVQKTFQGQFKNSAVVQGGGSTKVLIKIPNLLKHVDTLAKTKFAVNGAELVVPIDVAKTNSIFSAPSRLSLVACDSNGLNTYLRDQIYESGAYYGGNLVGNQYRFNIARHVQFVLDQYLKGNIHLNKNEDNITFFLIVPADNPVSASRAVINTSALNGIRLYLTYTQAK